MAARKLWKGEEAIPKNREPLKKKEWPPRSTLKKKEWPSRPPLKKNEWPSRRTPKKEEWPQKEEPLTIMKIKPAPRRSPTLKWNIKNRWGRRIRNG